MDIARLVAQRSTCLRRQVGAIIVRDRQILATGYNGAPRGLPHCHDRPELCMRKDAPSGQRAELCRALHAEQNAIIQAAVNAVSTEGAAVYVTHQPCSICAKMLINAGIKRVIFMGDYPDPLAREFLAGAGVALTRYTEVASIDAVQEDKRIPSDLERSR